MLAGIARVVADLSQSLVFWRDNGIEMWAALLFLLSFLYLALCMLKHVQDNGCLYVTLNTLLDR